MPVSVRTANRFSIHFRILFPNESISLDSLMKDRNYVLKLLDLASTRNQTTEMKSICVALLAELNGEAPTKFTSPSSTPSSNQSSNTSAPNNASTTFSPSDSASPGNTDSQERWDLLSQCARTAGGPIAGAMVSKYRKENPSASISDAKREFEVKLGSRFSSECSAKGL